MSTTTGERSVVGDGSTTSSSIRTITVQPTKRGLMKRSATVNRTVANNTTTNSTTSGNNSNNNTTSSNIIKKTSSPSTTTSTTQQKFGKIIHRRRVKASESNENSPLTPNTPSSYRDSIDSNTLLNNDPFENDNEFMYRRSQTSSSSPTSDEEDEETNKTSPLSTSAPSPRTQIGENNYGKKEREVYHESFRTIHTITDVLDDIAKSPSTNILFQLDESDEASSSSSEEEEEEILKSLDLLNNNNSDNNNTKSNDNTNTTTKIKNRNRDIEIHSLHSPSFLVTNHNSSFRSSNSSLSSPTSPKGNSKFLLSNSPTTNSPSLLSASLGGNKQHPSHANSFSGGFVTQSRRQQLYKSKRNRKRMKKLFELPDAFITKYQKIGTTSNASGTATTNNTLKSQLALSSPSTTLLTSMKKTEKSTNFSSKNLLFNLKKNNQNTPQLNTKEKEVDTRNYLQQFHQKQANNRAAVTNSNSPKKSIPSDSNEDITSGNNGGENTDNKIYHTFTSGNNNEEINYWTTFNDISQDEYIVEDFFVSNFSAMDLLYQIFYTPPVDKTATGTQTSKRKMLHTLYSGQILIEQQEQLQEIYRKVSKMKMCTIIRENDKRLMQNEKIHMEKLMKEEEEGSETDLSEEIELVFNETGEVENIFSMKDLLKNLNSVIINDIDNKKGNDLKLANRHTAINMEDVLNSNKDLVLITQKDLENEDTYDLNGKIKSDTKIEYYTIKGWLNRMLTCHLRRVELTKNNVNNRPAHFSLFKKLENNDAFNIGRTSLEGFEINNSITTTFEDNSSTIENEENVDDESTGSTTEEKNEITININEKSNYSPNTEKMLKQYDNELSTTELLDYISALACSCSTLFTVCDDWEDRIYELCSFLSTLNLTTSQQFNTILIFVGEWINYNQGLMSSKFITEKLLPFLNDRVLSKPESIPFVELFLHRIRDRSHLLSIRDQAQRTINLALDNFSDNILDLDMLNISSFQLAIQLTLIEFDLFSMMEPHEFYCSYWLTKCRYKVKTRDPSPNLSLFIQWYNTVSLWVTETILKYSDIKERYKVLCRFISLAWGCYSVRNYNGCFEIISGLYSNEVYRLTKTWAMLNDEYLKKAETLIELTSVANNYRNYREELKSAKKPCIPNIPVHLKDLASVDDAQEDERKLEDKEVDSNFKLFDKKDNDSLLESIEYNYSKRRLQTNLIIQLLKYQRVSYPFKANEKMKHYLWYSLLKINQDIKRGTEEKRMTIEKYIQEKKRQLLTRSKQLEPKSSR
ncbi:hypothetical protein ABK040_009180 [Willaertia magna]